MVSNRHFGSLGPLCLMLLLTLPLMGCWAGRTRINVSDGGSYDIYSNDTFLCNTTVDECKLLQRGGAGTVTLEAKVGDEVVGSKVAQRSITAASVLWGPFTYWTSLFLYKAYPDEITINVAPRYDQASKPSVWREPEKPKEGDADDGLSVWERPVLNR